MYIERIQAGFQTESACTKVEILWQIAAVDVSTPHEGSVIHIYV